MKSGFAHRLEEGIVVLLILMQALDFLELLPGDVDYAKKILSWSALGYLVYKINLADILFGRREQTSVMNLLILASYFLLITKNITGYSMIAEEAHFFRPIIEFMAENAFLIESFSFYIGGTMLILISAYLAFAWRIDRPSLMHVIHEEGPPPRSIQKLVVRFVSVYLVLVSFFIVVFNLMMEWLAMAVDALLVTAALFFYLFIVVRHYRKLSPETLIYKVGSAGESFYEEFIGLFHDKRRIFLGISGMLVLHLLTDVANFIVPYIVSRQDALYFGSLAPASHQSLARLLVADFATTNSLLGKVVVTWTYGLNVIGALMLMTLPAFIWYKLYSRQGITASPIAISVFFASVAVLLISPVFGMSPIEVAGEGELVGVDFQTSSISGSAVFASIASVAFGILSYLASRSHRVRRKLILLEVIIINTLFGLYVYLFFKSTWAYYVDSILLLLKNSYVFIGTHMLMFFTITILFYVGGFFIFVMESKKEFEKVMN